MRARGRSDAPGMDTLRAYPHRSNRAGLGPRAEGKPGAFPLACESRKKAKRRLALRFRPRFTRGEREPFSQRLVKRPPRPERAPSALARLSGRVRSVVRGDVALPRGVGPPSASRVVKSRGAHLFRRICPPRCGLPPRSRGSRRVISSVRPCRGGWVGVSAASRVRPDDSPVPPRCRAFPSRREASAPQPAAHRTPRAADVPPRRAELIWGERSARGQGRAATPAGRVPRALPRGVPAFPAAGTPSIAGPSSHRDHSPDPLPSRRVRLAAETSPGLTIGRSPALRPKRPPRGRAPDRTSTDDDDARRGGRMGEGRRGVSKELQWPRPRIRPPACLGHRATRPRTPRGRETGRATHAASLSRAACGRPGTSPPGRTSGPCPRIPAPRRLDSGGRRRRRRQESSPAIFIEGGRNREAGRRVRRRRRQPRARRPLRSNRRPHRRRRGDEFERRGSDVTWEPRIARAREGDAPGPRQSRRAVGGAYRRPLAATPDHRRRVAPRVRADDAEEEYPLRDADRGTRETNRAELRAFVDAMDPPFARRSRRSAPWTSSILRHVARCSTGTFVRGPEAGRGEPEAERSANLARWACRGWSRRVRRGAMSRDGCGTRGGGLAFVARLWRAARGEARGRAHGRASRGEGSEGVGARRRAETKKISGNEERGGARARSNGSQTPRRSVVAAVAPNSYSFSSATRRAREG